MVLILNIVFDLNHFPSYSEENNSSEQITSLACKASEEYPMKRVVAVTVTHISFPFV